MPPRPKLFRMEPTLLQTYLPILVVAAIAATAAVLIYGVVQMVKPSATAEESIAKARRSNKLMQWRIILQAAALLLFLLMLAMR